MNSQQKIINLLTVCIKAGKVVKGFDSVCGEIKKGNVSCVMTAADISPKSLKPLLSAASSALSSWKLH